ncbi:hypothetical protein Tco_0018078 [Tanacetum coccineum]
MAAVWLERRRWWWCVVGSGGVVAVVTAAVAAGGGGEGKRRVAASECGDRIDRLTRNTFGFGRKSFPPAAAWWWPKSGGGAVAGKHGYAFWNTTTSKIVNPVKQIHAIVYGKVVVISESSVRNDLLFDDEDGITCITNDDIFENLALMGYEQLSTKLTFQKENTERHKNIGEPKKVTELPQTSVPLDLGADAAGHKEGGDSVERAITTDASLVAAQDSDNIISTQTTAMPNVDIPQGMDTEGHTFGSGEGRMAHTFELMDIVSPTPYDSPLPGGYIPGSDEGRLKLEELMAICIKLSKQIASSDDDLDEEDASKQGRKSDKTKTMFKDSDFDGLDDDMENVEGKTVYAATSGVSTAGALVSTARPTVSTAGPSTSAAGTSTMVITDTKQEQRRLTTPPPSRPSNTRDKGKDVELAQLLHQKELAQVEWRQREKAAQEEASIAKLYEEYDTIQANIDADALFAARLQQEEREHFTIEERAQFLVETIAAQRKFRVAQRAAEIRSKPPTKTQLRNMMITYLKNMGKFVSHPAKAETRGGTSWISLQHNGVYYRDTKRKRKQSQRTLCVITIPNTR